MFELPNAHTHTHICPQKLDFAAENVTVAEADDTTTTETIASKVPTDSPRYHFLAYPHEQDGQSVRPISMCLLRPFPLQGQ